MSMIPGVGDDSLEMFLLAELHANERDVSYSDFLRDDQICWNILGESPENCENCQTKKAGNCSRKT